MKIKLFIVLVALLNLFLCVASAHSGRTDANGGHYNRSTGEYHYHHGYPEHQHENGICPYSFEDRTGQNAGAENNKEAKQKETEIGENFTVYVFIFIAFVVGTFGFSQIIGSIQTRQRNYIFTILFWIVILATEFFLMRTFWGSYMMGYYAGTIISLLASLGAGKIR